MIVVLHDLNLAAGYADRVVLLNRQRGTDGTPPGALTEDNLQRVYQQMWWCWSIAARVPPVVVT